MIRTSCASVLALSLALSGLSALAQEEETPRVPQNAAAGPRPTATPNARSYFDKGQNYGKAKNWALAISEYTKAIGMNPDYYTDAYWNRGHAYIQIGQFLKALTDFNKAIQIDPDYAIAYNNRGNVYLGLGQSSLADADKTKACSLDSKYC